MDEPDGEDVARPAKRARRGEPPATSQQKPAAAAEPAALAGAGAAVAEATDKAAGVVEAQEAPQAAPAERNSELGALWEEVDAQANASGEDVHTRTRGVPAY